MSSAGSITHWLARLKAGNPAAAQPLWEAYFQQLVRRARPKLTGRARSASDEEDVALSAFDSFCRGAAQGRFPRLDDRNDLWQVLIVLADRKAVNRVRHERRAKRGGGRVRPEGGLPAAGASTGDSPLAQVPGAEPTPEFAALVAEEYEWLLDCLGDARLRSVAVWKMEGYTIAEIAARLGCVPRTVDRHLQLIRDIWEEERGHG
jgi:DNA-directed RNA polymerase specialized sigma24 family protein